MLNVDAHSSSVKKKMTRDTFVKQNLLCTKNAVDKSFIEHIYDSITTTPLACVMDVTELVYSRIPEQFLPLASTPSLDALVKGIRVTKYARNGNKGTRWIYLSDDKSKLLWKKCHFVVNDEEKLNNLVVIMTEGEGG